MLNLIKEIVCTLKIVLMQEKNLHKNGPMAIGYPIAIGYPSKEKDKEKEPSSKNLFKKWP